MAQAGRCVAMHCTHHHHSMLMLPLVGSKLVSVLYQYTDAHVRTRMRRAHAHVRRSVRVSTCSACRAGLSRT